MYLLYLTVETYPVYRTMTLGRGLYSSPSVPPPSVRDCPDVGRKYRGDAGVPQRQVR